jgi:hypothetical protein
VPVLDEYLVKVFPISKNSIPIWSDFWNHNWNWIILRTQGPGTRFQFAFMCETRNWNPNKDFQEKKKLKNKRLELG